MNGNSEPAEADMPEVMPPTHRRILVIMAILGVAGAIAGVVFHSAGFGLGILIGSGLAFVNYYWLKRSLQRVFADAVEGQKPKISALRYILRYVTMAAVIAVIFMTGVLPVVAVILGMGGFGFAVVIDGFIRIFQGAEARTK